jgi:hypothetical protein
MAFVTRSTLIIATLVAALSVSCKAQGAASDPFANQTVAVAHSPLVEEWFASIRKLDRGHTLLGACVDRNVTGCEAARQLHDIIEDAKAQNGLALIGHINRAVNFMIKPVTPSGWLSPFEGSIAAVIANPIRSPSILPCSRPVFHRIICASLLSMRVQVSTWSSRFYGKIAGSSLII